MRPGTQKPRSKACALVAAVLGFSLISSGPVISAALADTTADSSAESSAKQPNIVVVLVDDAALMDFGAFGGEAATPNIDALAERGAMFTQYRTSPLCAPTRAMLLTGIDNHKTGVATIPEVIPDEHRGQPGYTLSLEPGVLTIADRLRSVGYRTLMSGKWHLGDAEDEMPQNHGFDRSLALAASGADNWEDKSFMPYYHEAPWYEDGKPYDLPEDFYSSKYLVDKMIDYLETTDPDKPFFAYLPFQAIHIPVQAPAEFTANYKGKFDEGWHVMREARYQRAQELGLIREGAPIAPMPANSRDWNSLSDEDRALYAALMEVNAGMLEAMDFHIGRFMDHLKDAGTFDNTIFLVTSDNGPEHNRGDNSASLAIWMHFNGYHINLEGVGEVGSWGFIGPEWANAAASPGDLFKFYTTEGGIRVPLIISGPGVEPMRVDSPAMVTDLAPTLLDLVGAPKTALADDTVPLTGRSLFPVLTGATDSVYGADDIRALEVSGNSALYKGDYKITRNNPPAGDSRWRLFNMADDPGETTDLSESEPDIMQDMLASFDAYSREMGVLEMPAGYDTVQQITKNSVSKVLEHYGWMIAIMALVLIGLIAGTIFGTWRMLRSRAA